MKFVKNDAQPEVITILTRLPIVYSKRYDRVSICRSDTNSALLGDKTLTRLEMLRYKKELTDFLKGTIEVL